MANRRLVRCRNDAHEGECSGPTGVFQLAICGNCKGSCYTDTCWLNQRRVPSDTPILCDECSGQGVLL